jgi:hypothetical protein
MRAFILSVVALVAITVAAAVGLQMIAMPSSDLFSERPNVRL